MTDQMLHTPDGVRDIYNGECKQKLLLQERLHDVLRQYGYRDIQTPTFEFFNIFGKEIGTTPSKDLYKFFDKDGSTLVLRPDFTPSIARSAAKYYTEDDMPVKLCYMGNTFINSNAYQGRLKETTQCGAELIGDGITTFVIHPYEIGKAAGELIIERLENPDGEKKMRLTPTDIVYRNSTLLKKEG